MKAVIVDDERHVREGIRLLGEWDRFGIEQIYEAGNGEEAIQLIQQYRPEIIFSDMKMPKMDGTQLLEWIKENYPDSKTVVVTGYDDYHYMRKAINFGSFDYLLKPVDPESLNQTLAKAVKEWETEEARRITTKSSPQSNDEMTPVYHSIADIEKYLQDHYDREVKLQEIADVFFLSREYISRKFKQEFGENISDYIVKIRMQKAKSLLKNSELKIYEIANMIGYQDDKYFRKVFKKVEGITPNEFRSSYQNNNIKS
ncbi:response regulator [Neobacillus sp. PS3-12]|jgi:two-component system, response regulator YesN|uniref:response regulator transcription factor n=1 Tax=Neobacillus sp. PS3-12 TaxID=3070677 RepID=UPI0027E15103|nr:response regulator [Neobacillus sp. PS3-12]WML51403.1 response regulator [Neobacillus sp. PS3-12]